MSFRDSNFKLLTSNNGLTLIELLVVIVIMGVISTIGFGQYRKSQLKARDAQRKGDLDNIARALEMYYNDHESFPGDSDDSGFIEVDTGDGAVDDLAWGETFETTEVVYMKTLPEDPNDDYSYCYESDAQGSFFKLFAILENTDDADFYGDPSDPSSGYSCGGDQYYRYGISSSNTTL